MSQFVRIPAWMLGLVAVLACASVGLGASTLADTFHDDHRNTPRFQIEPAWTGSALEGEDLARAFLLETAQTYELPADLSNLRLARVQESLLGMHYHFQQTIGGYDVEGAEIIVSVLKSDNSIYRVYNNTYPVKRAVEVPSAVIDSETAYDIVWAALHAAGDLHALPVQKVVYVPRGEGFQLQSVIYFELSEPFGAWETRLDATTGDVISIEDSSLHRVKTVATERTVAERIAEVTAPLADRQAAFARVLRIESDRRQALDQAQSRRASGTGVVFDPDPRTTLNDATLQDGSPASAFTAAYVTRNLEDITFNGSTYSLTGPWINIINFESPNTAPSTTADGNWTATRGNNAFNDALTYFHIDQNQRYMQSLGFSGATGIQEGPIGTDTDGLSGADNSHYIPSSNRMAFGHGCVDDSEDADVVLHEYGHAIHYSINSNWGGGDAGAIGEGFGDYWAGSYSYSTFNGDVFHPEWVFSWDGHGVPVGCWNGRILDAFGAQYVPGTTYGAHQGIPGGYQSDELWSTPLFQSLLELVGMAYTRESVDQIILESHFGIGSGVTMRDMANATIATAGLLQPGNPHADVFIQKFLVHNIVEVPFVGLTVESTAVTGAGGNGAADPGETVNLQVTLKNAGTLGATSVSAILTSSTPGVVITNGVSGYNDLPPGASEVNLADFVLTIPASLPCGDPVVLNLEVDYSEPTVTTTNLGFELGTGEVIGVSQSIEPGLSIPDNNPSGVTSVMAVSGTGATVTADFNVDINLTHTYIGDLIVRLTSPGGTTVTLHNRSGGSANDLIGNYPGTLTPAQPLSNFIGDPIDGDWTMFVSDNAGIDLGTLNSWAIHDVQGYDCEAAVDVPDPGVTALRFALDASQPNPFGDRTNIRFAVPNGDARTTLEIVDASGRLVRTLVDEVLPAGAYAREWDRSDDRGHRVQSGVYFYRLRQGSQSLTQKVLAID